MAEAKCKWAREMWKGSRDAKKGRTIVEKDRGEV
jgi:hypothetical protein